MRKLLTIISIFICSSSFARLYYVSNTGNDANDGLTIATPWATIAKVNAASATMAPGDQILFKRGDSFHGALIPKKSGNAANPIRIGAYGTGARPIITGMIPVTGWTNLGGNIWEATATPTVKATVNIFTIDGTAVEIGRTPNAYTTYSSATTTTLNSTFFATAPAGAYIGAEVVCKKSSFIIVRSRVTAQTIAGITYTPIAGLDNGGGLSPVNGSPGFGFFMQRAASTLDLQNEWYFNPTTKKMRVYSTTNPSSFVTKISDIDTVIVLANTTNIVVENIAIEGAGSYGVESYLGGQITVQNCDFNNNTRAVYIWNSDDAVVQNNTTNHSFNNAILVSNNQKRRITVKGNTLANTGQLIGIGTWNSNNNLKGIVVKTDSTQASNSIDVSRNDVYKTGYMGIEIQGSNVYVHNNFVHTYCNTLDDGGGIYTYSGLTTATKIYSNRFIYDNIVRAGIGSPDGTTRTEGDVVGIYIDDNSMNLVITGNTVDSVPGPGVQLNDTKNVIIRSNTFYNCDISININKKKNTFLQNNKITQNIIYQKNAGQFIVKYTDAHLVYPTPRTFTQSIQQMGLFDSNYITNQKTSGFRAWYGDSGTINHIQPDFPLTNWRATYVHDVISDLPPIPVSPTNTVLPYNPTDTVLVYRFAGLRKMTPDGVAHDNLINVPRWGSAVLIANGSAPLVNDPPNVDAGNDQNITLPTNTATLAGVVTDPGGSIDSIIVTKVSGPAGGTITNQYSATTGITALQAGTYTYQIYARDNLGATASDVMQIIIHPAIPPANTPPVVSADTNRTIRLPISTTTFVGSATDADGIRTYAWVKIAGPDTYTIASPNSATTAINDLQAGVYTFQLTATDSLTASSTAVVTVTVLAAPLNESPTVYAGRDTILVLPLGANYTVVGAGADAEGSVTYTWTKTAFPAGDASAITSPAAASTGLTGLISGVYQFTLTVTDTNGATAQDTVQLTINAEPAPPMGGIILRAKL